MSSFVLSYEELELITSRLSQFYINNESTLDFLKEHHYKISLQDYLCICYGVENTPHRTRKIEFFRFIGLVEENGGYWVESLMLPTTEEMERQGNITLLSSSLFRIQDCHYLRQTIFEFQDKTSLFRSTLFYVPKYKKLFRIHCVLQFLTLPIFPQSQCKNPLLAEKFLVSETKKKQILKRLRDQMSLCEAALEAHGALERTILKSNH